MVRNALILVFVVAIAFTLGHVSGQQDTPEAMPMPEWMKLDEEHAKMAKSVGDWQVAAQMWMAPGAPPMEFTGHAKREMILGGRFLQETFTCEFMGAPFEGRLIQSYDTLAKEHVTVWIDNMSPFLYTSRGKSEGNTTTLMGEGPDAMTGKLKKEKTISKIVSDDEVRVSAFTVLPDGSEQPSMKFVYRRKK